MAKKKPSKKDVAAAKAKPSGKRTWKLMDRGATVVGGMLATRATAVAWRGLSGKQPPNSGRHPEVSTREAVLWAIVGGGLTELVKTGIRRGTATYWVRSTGELPPGMKPLRIDETAAEFGADDRAPRSRRSKRSSKR